MSRHSPEVVERLVWAALQRAKRPLSAGEIASRIRIGQLAVTYALQRLAAAKQLYVSADVVTTATRVSEIQLLYQARVVVPAARRWPEWLDPRRLPTAVLGVRRRLAERGDE